MEKTEKNVMLTCLSLMRPTFSKSLYGYEHHLQSHYVEGYATNEAPMKRVIGMLDADDRKLDRVIMLCSVESGKKIRDYNGYGCKHLSEDLDDEGVIEEDFKNQTHRKYYKYVIEKFVGEQVKKGGWFENIDFREVEVANFVNKEDIMKSVVESANLVTDFPDENISNDQIHLYVDFNGGPRVVMMMQLILCSLLKQRDVDICDISYMDFENKNDVPKKDLALLPDNKWKKPLKEGGKLQYSLIGNIVDIFNCMDLVAGVNEYVSYGRIRTLRQYFENCENERIQSILRSLEDFADNMQLCLTDYILQNRNVLKSELDEWKRGHGEDSREDVYEIMFSFVVDDILKGCAALLDGELPDIIAWCVERDFIQQALVFYEQEMPMYFWDHGILHPSDSEWLEYMQWRAEGELGDGSISEDRGQYLEMDQGYCWLNHYLLHKDGMQDGGSGDPVETVMAATTVAGQGDGQEKSVRMGRATTCVGDSDGLRTILTDYFQIREQCVTTRKHMSSMGDRGKLWPYEEMKKRLTDASRRVKSP